MLSKDESELKKRVYLSQKNNPIKNDWINLLKNDFELIGENLDDSTIKLIKKNKYKIFIKEKIRKAAFFSTRKVSRSQ